MEQRKKTLRGIFSMRTAITLLLLLCVACVAGSIIPQGEMERYYTNLYPGNPSRLILLLGLDDVFHSLWFLLLTAVLCLNLLGCNVLRFPSILRQYRQGFTLERCLAGSPGGAEVRVADPAALFRRMGFPRPQETQREGQRYWYAVRHKPGLWGAWLTHLALLLIVAGFALGQALSVQYTVYGVPGTTRPVGDTVYTLTIDDFTVALREDNTVEQYTARLTMTETATGEQRSGESSVNHPLSLFGMKLYQNSMGWAAQVDILEDGKPLQSEVLCTGEHLSVADKPELAVMLHTFYPDLVTGPDGKSASASGEVNRPGYLYAVYYNGEVVGMNVLTEGEEITIDQYTVRFSQPRHYTLIQLKHDPFTWLALLGGLVMLAALFLAFYLPVEELWAWQREDGGWSAAGRSRKGGILFQEKLKAAAGEGDNT